MKPSFSQKLTYGCLAFTLLMGAVPTHAQSQDPPASLVFEMVDAATNSPLPGQSLAGLTPGQQVRIRINARDGMGRDTKCSPNVQATGGHQTEVRADGTILMTIGNAFGSAELIASCTENRTLVHKEFMSVNTPLGGPRPAMARSRAPAPAASPASNTGLIIGVVAGSVAIVGLAAAAALGAEDEVSSSSCPTLSQCCSTTSQGLPVSECGAPQSCQCPSGSRDFGICEAGRPCSNFGFLGSRICNCL